MGVIHIGSDHAGYDLKEFIGDQLRKQGLEVRDHGTTSRDSCDYPLIAHSLCKAVVAEQGQGILICGTGLGMSMAANRHPDIRAALCRTELEARLSRRHNNANILCLGARITGSELAWAIAGAFLEANFEGGRHQRRIDQLNPAG